MNHKSSREGLSSYERICGEFVRLNKKTLDDREPLHMVFKNEAEKSEKRLKQIHEETLGR